jgi:hypothetical protein
MEKDGKKWSSCRLRSDDAITASAGFDEDNHRLDSYFSLMLRVLFSLSNDFANFKDYTIIIAV